jgi:hypothetical protein
VDVLRKWSPINDLTRVLNHQTFNSGGVPFLIGRHKHNAALADAAQIHGSRQLNGAIRRAARVDEIRGHLNAVPG